MQYEVEIGGTQIELTEEGNTALRLRDIVVRDRDGAVVASAPKAEVGISGTSLMLGSIKPQRLSLIGAAMAVRIESDGRVTVFAGADKRPIAISPPRPLAPADHAPEGTVSAKSVPAAGELAVLLGWLDQLDALGLDGRGLTEIGLKNGSLIVDDRRSGKQLAFENINLSLTRSRDSGVAFAINSTGADGPWSLAATVTPRSGGQRDVEMIARDVSPKDLMLALRVSDGQFSADVPLSAVIRAEIERDGTLSAPETIRTIQAANRGPRLITGICFDPAATAGQSWPPSPMIKGMKGGIVCASPLVSRTAKAYSFQAKIKQKIAVAAIPVVACGRTTLKNA